MGNLGTCFFFSFLFRRAAVIFFVSSAYSLQCKGETFSSLRHRNRIRTRPKQQFGCSGRSKLKNEARNRKRVALISIKVSKVFRKFPNAVKYSFHWIAGMSTVRLLLWVYIYYETVEERLNKKFNISGEKGSNKAVVKLLYLKLISTLRAYWCLWLAWYALKE